MKAKKFLKIVKHMCSDANCVYGKCPMAVEKENYSSCLMIASENTPDDWKIKKMLNNSGNDFVNFVVKEFGELAELFKQKNEQYGGRDPLANFRTGALMEKGFDTWPAMFDEAKNYQRKHVAHVQNCNISGPKVDESLKDIAVYAVIMLYMRTKYLEQIAEVGKSDD